MVLSDVEVEEVRRRKVCVAGGAAVGVELEVVRLVVVVCGELQALVRWEEAFHLCVLWGCLCGV